MDGKGGLSATTVLYHHRILSKALNSAIKLGLIGRNVCAAVDPPRPRRKRIVTLAPEDVHKLLKASQDTPYYLLFYTAIYTGMRLGELLGLPWREVDLRDNHLRVVQALHKRSGVCKITQPKTSRSRRRISLPGSLALLLREHRENEEAKRSEADISLRDDDFVFGYPDGRPLDPSTVSHSLGHMLEKAGLPHMRFHDLRHTHATLLLMGGYHPKVVSERLGHKSISITLDTYSHVLPSLQEEVAEHFDALLQTDVYKMFTEEENLVSEAHRTRTCNRLIKSQLLCLLS